VIRSATGFRTGGAPVTNKERLFAGLKCAALWTVYLFMGSKVGKPAAWPVVGIRLLGYVTMTLIKVVVIAGATAILNDGLHETNIKNFAELGKTQNVLGDACR
jgi:hypothetical protein